MDADEVNQIWQGRREGVCGAKSIAPNAMHRNGARWAGRATEAGRSRVPPAAQKAEAISIGNVIYSGIDTVADSFMGDPYNGRILRHDERT
jgi:hypothetical protein